MSSISIKLGELTNITTGKLDANASDSEGQYPFFTCAVQPLRINNHAFDCEAVLIAGNGDLNAKYYNGKFNAYQRTYVIQSKDKSILDVKWLYYFLDSYLVKLREMAIGGVIKYIKLPYLTDAEVNLPSLDEQRMVVEQLDSVSRIKYLRNNSFLKIDELASSLFQSSLVNGSKIETDEVGNLFEFVRNGYNIKQGVNDEGLPITRIETIANSEINLKRVGFAGLVEQDCQNYLLKDGDILFSHINSVSHLGKCAIYKSDMGPLVHGMNLLCFRPNRLKILPCYALFSIRSALFREQMAKSVKKAVNQASLSTGDLKKIMLTLPSLEVQMKFCEAISKIEIQKSKLKNSREKIEDIFNSIKHRSFRVN